MGQAEIYEFLKNRRLSGDEAFYTYREVAKELLENPNYVTRDLRILHSYGYLDLEQEGFNHRKYRYKNRLVAEAKV